jgi:hypothetical protein
MQTNVNGLSTCGWHAKFEGQETARNILDNTIAFVDLFNQSAYQSSVAYVGISG